MPFRIGSARCAMALALGFGAPLVARAQTSADTVRPAPYSRLRFRIAAARSVDREPVDGFYRAGTGGAFAIVTPFYVGSIGVAGTLIPFNAVDHSVSAGRPNLRALLLAVDWGADLPLRGPLRARASAQLGDFVMIIENPDRWLDSESELLLGAALSAGYALRRDLSLTATGSVARVYTRPALDLGILTLGLEYTTRTPGWLRAFLE